MRKKGLAIVLSLAMVLTVTGCGKGNGKSTSSKGEVKVPEYKGLEIYESDIDVDDQVESAIQQLLSSKATTEQETSGKVKKTDKVNIDYVGSIDGFEFDGGTAQGYTLDIANSTFIEGFAEGLVGKKVGDTVDLNLTFPEDYSNTTTDADGNEMTLAGKDVLFKVTINYKEVTVTPEYNDEFVQTNYSSVGSTTAEFDEYVKRQLQISAAMTQVWNDFMEDCEVKSYPDGEVESYQTYLNDMYVQQLQSYYGTDLATYLETCSMTQEEWDDQMKESSETVIKQGLIVDKIVEEQGIEVKKDTDDYKKLALKLAQLNGIDSVETLETSYDTDTILAQLNYEAAQAYVFDNLKINKGERPTEEATEAETSAEEASTDAE